MWSNEHIVLELHLSHSSVSKLHLSYSILLVIDPFSIIKALKFVIWLPLEGHLAQAMSLSILEMAQIYCTISIMLSSKAVWYIILPFSVYVGFTYIPRLRLHDHLALTMSLTIFHLTGIYTVSTISTSF